MIQTPNLAAIAVIFAGFACVPCNLKAQVVALPEDDIEELQEIPEEEIERLGINGSIIWIANAQKEDGSWPRQTAKSDPENVTLSTTNATGLGLLALMGAGQTHKEGFCKANVHRGIAYLIRQMRVEKELGDLRGDGDLEGHGAAALALCEAYGMTLDRQLIAPAQLAVRFTERCQHETGGWALQPGKADDIHTMGWHVLTLRSAWMNSLLFRERTILRLDGYLDRHQVDDGRGYKRVMDGRDAKATAIGLLGRGETEWSPKSDKRWQDGAAWLAKRGPAAHDAEFNFWATLVIRNSEGDHWAAWNEELREQIVKTQWKTGDHHASWYDAKDRRADRGRFYQTALNTLTMEIYYRHLVIYRGEFKGELQDEVDPAGPDVDPFGADDPFGS